MPACHRHQWDAPVTHFIMLLNGLDEGAAPEPELAETSGDSGMINAQPESLSLPSMVTSSPLTLPTTFMRLDWEMTSSRSGKTAYLRGQVNQLLILVR